MNKTHSCKCKCPLKSNIVVDHRLVSAKLLTHDWLKDIPPMTSVPELVEVRFKNTRKAIFTNKNKLPLEVGDIVAVEATIGHDIGIVSLVGELVKEQMRLKYIDIKRTPLLDVYRIAKDNDIEKWEEAISRENDTMIKSRQIANDLNLNMKIGDVEYQGDMAKAIFYYIADERVDFRNLIRVLAETFKVRVEMKQIGARQEAGRIGGIGPCGRNLCCSSFVTNFVSVSTISARYQDISLNPQKLAGQCGKLKCCLNYEVDAYIDQQKDFPSTKIQLNTGEGILYHQKTDIFGNTMHYSFDKDGKGLFIKIDIVRVKEIIALNKKGIIPPKASLQVEEENINIGYTDGVGEGSLSRFDDGNRKKSRNNRKKKKPNDINLSAPNTENKQQNTPNENTNRKKNRRKYYKKNSGNNTNNNNPK